MSTVLVVDDEQSFRSLLSEALQNAGHDPVLASNGAEALQIAQEHKEDIPLVVTDFTMPGMSGIELLRTLRDRRPDMRGILLTGHWIHPMPEDLNAIYLMKPCPISKFIATVNQLLGTSDTDK
jgi:two-component system, cell cycle sensor histidine kinase and response regulator CckA